MLAASLAMDPIDLTIIVVYLVGIVAIGCLASFRQRRTAEGQGYFLAGRTLTWPVIGLALFSTNISTVHLVSLAEEGYKNGLAYGNFEWMAAFTLIILALFFAPFYLRSRVLSELSCIISCVLSKNSRFKKKSGFFLTGLIYWPGICEKVESI